MIFLTARNHVVSFSAALPLVVQSTKCTLDQSGQLIRGIVDGLVQSGCHVCDHDRLKAFEAGFHHAALVVLAALISILITQMDFHSCDAIAEPCQCSGHDLGDLGCQRFATFNVMVGIDLDLHQLLGASPSLAQ